MDLNSEPRRPEDILAWVRRIVDDRLARYDLMLDQSGTAAFEEIWDRPVRTVVRKPHWFPQGQAEMFRKVSLYAEQVALTTKAQDSPRVAAEQVADATRAFAEYSRSPFCPTAADTSGTLPRDT